MFRTYLIILTALVFVALAFSEASGGTYFIAPDGDDSNDGLSIMNAWQHLQMGCTASVIVAGDTVVIRGGYWCWDGADSSLVVGDTTGAGASCTSYWPFMYNELLGSASGYGVTFEPQITGTVTDTIWYKGYPDEALPRICGVIGETGGTSRHAAGINIDYAMFDSLRFSLGGGHGNVELNGAGHVRFRWCDNDSAWGEGKNNCGGFITDANGNYHNADYIEIYSCHIWDIRNYTGLYHVNASGITAYGMGHVIARKNWIHGCENAIFYKGDSAVDPEDTTLHLIMTDSNLVQDCTYLRGTLGGTVDSFVIAYNVFDGQGIYTDFAGKDADGPFNKWRYWIYNNTLILGGSSDGIACRWTTAGRSVHFVNNLTVNPREDNSTDVGTWRGAIGFKNERDGPFDCCDYVDTLQIDYNVYSLTDSAGGDYFNYYPMVDAGSGTFDDWIAEDLSSYGMVSWAANQDANSKVGDPEFTGTGVNWWADAGFTGTIDFEIDSTSIAATGGIGGDYPSYIGAFAPEGEVVTCSTSVDQAWFDASGGVISTANGDVAGDVFCQTEDIYCPSQGIMVTLDNITWRGNGYTVYVDTMSVNTITNGGFETADTDTTRATGWDFTDADSVLRQAGHYQCITDGTDDATVWEGNYALRVHVPCADQIVKSSATYTFEPGTAHCIEAVIHQVENSAVVMEIGLLSTDGDTLYSAKYTGGLMQRGGEPLYCAWVAPDTAQDGYIFLQVTGASGISAGDQIYIDDVQHSHYRRFGFAFEMDTSETFLDEISMREYFPDGDTTGVMASSTNREGWGLPVSGGSADNFLLDSVNIQFTNPSTWSWGIYGNPAASGVTINRCAIYPKGSNADGIFTWNGINWTVDSCLIDYPDDPIDYHYTKREALPSVGVNLRADKANYGYGSTISYTTVKDYPFVGVYMRTRCDGTNDATKAYEPQTVEYCTFNGKTLLTNGFAIEDGGECNGWIVGNTIDCMTGGYHGAGIHVTGKQWDADSLMYGHVTGNTVVTETYPYSQEYSYGNLAFAMQFEDAEICSVYANSFTAYTLAADAPSVEAIRLNYYSNDLYTFKNNYVAAWSDNTSMAACLNFYPTDPVYSYVESATESWDIDSNTFVTNSNLLIGFTNMYGMELVGNSFDFSDSLTEKSWIKAKCGHASYGPAHGLHFVDNRYVDAEVDSAFQQAEMFQSYNSTTTADIGSQWEIDWTQTATFLDTLGNAANGALIRWVDQAGDTLISATLDGTGVWSNYVAEQLDSNVTATWAASYRTSYNDYTLRVYHQGVTYDTTVTVEQAQNFTVQLPSGVVEPTAGGGNLIMLLKP